MNGKSFDIQMYTGIINHGFAIYNGMVSMGIIIIASVVMSVNVIDYNNICMTVCTAMCIMTASSPMPTEVYT